MHGAAHPEAGTGLEVGAHQEREVLACLCRSLSFEPPPRAGVPTDMMTPPILLIFDHTRSMRWWLAEPSGAKSPRTQGMMQLAGPFLRSVRSARVRSAHAPCVDRRPAPARSSEHGASSTVMAVRLSSSALDRVLAPPRASVSLGLEDFGVGRWAGRPRRLRQPPARRYRQCEPPDGEGTGEMGQSGGHSGVEAVVRGTCTLTESNVAPMLAPCHEQIPRQHRR